MLNLNSSLFIFVKNTYNKHLAHTIYGPILKKIFFKIFYSLQKIEKFIQKKYGTQYKMCWHTKTKIMKNCIVLGGSRFLFQGNNCYINAVQSKLELPKIFQQYYFQEEMVGKVIYDPVSQRITSPKPKIDLYLKGCWLSLLSTSSVTWMHFLSEYVPIIENVLQTNDQLDFGILYEENLPQQSIECLKIIAGSRPLIAVQDKQTILVEKLVIPKDNSSIYISVWPRKNFIGIGYYIYDNNSLLRVRANVLNHFKIIPHKNNNIFIDRESKFRFISNNEEIKKFLNSRGFKSVLPARLTFVEQVQIFSQANLVIVQAGSALANIMFMPSGSKVICMCAKSIWANFAYFVDYAKIFGVDIIYVEGPIEDEDKYSIQKPCSIEHPMNANFHIFLHELENALQRFVCNV